MNPEDFQPYYAVIFSSLRKSPDPDYDEMAKTMESLAAMQPGFLGFEHARNELGISVSYWKDEESIRQWKKNADHRLAQELGRSDWYSWYKIRICKVEREYEYHSAQ